MKLPIAIDCPNLKETIVEIRLLPNPDVQRDLWAGLLSSEFERIGFKYQTVPQFNVTKEGEGAIKLSIDKDSVNSSINLFINEEKGVRALINGSTLTFNCEKGRYLGWEVYLDIITKFLQAFHDTHIVQAYERTMLRYISEYEDNILENVKIKVTPNTESEYKPLDIILTREEESARVYISISGKRERISEPNQEKRISSLFDVNVFDKLPCDAGLNEVLSSLNKIHLMEKKAFFGMLKEDYIKSLNPVYE